MGLGVDHIVNLLELFILLVDSLDKRLALGLILGNVVFELTSGRVVGDDSGLVAGFEVFELLHYVL